MLPRLAALLLAGFQLAAAATAVATEAPDPYPGAAAAYAVMVNGVVLWERAAHEPLPPASLTKIMTAVLLLEEWMSAGGEPAAVLTVSAKAASTIGSRLGLRTGERMRVTDALTAMLVASANDACLALAEHAAGSVDAFVARMNRRAEGLGLGATRFVNPCGLDAPGHRSSVADLLRLSRHAMEIPGFASRVALREASVATLGGRRFRLESGNQLLGRVDGAVGIKSGFTGRAGKCLSALVRRGRDEVLVVLLNAPDRWWSADVLIEDAFAALDASRR